MRRCGLLGDFEAATQASVSFQDFSIPRRDLEQIPAVLMHFAFLIKTLSASNRLFPFSSEFEMCWTS